MVRKLLRHSQTVCGVWWNYIIYIGNKISCYTEINTWIYHIQYIPGKNRMELEFSKKVREFLSKQRLLILCHSFIYPCLPQSYMRYIPITPGWTAHRPSKYSCQNHSICSFKSKLRSHQYETKCNKTWWYQYLFDWTFHSFVYSHKVPEFIRTLFKK